MCIGVAVDVERLIEQIMTLSIPSEIMSAAVEKFQAGDKGMFFVICISCLHCVAARGKRTLSESSDEETAVGAGGPSKDIFRKRQKEKIARNI